MKGPLLILGMIVLAISLSGCTGTPTVSSSPTPAPEAQDDAFWDALNSSFSEFSAAYFQFSDDLDKQDYQALASSGAKLSTVCEQQYNMMSRFSVSPKFQGMQTNYMRALQEYKQAGDYGSKAAIAVNNKEPDLATEYLGRTGVYLESGNQYMDLMDKSLKQYVDELKSG